MDAKLKFSHKLIALLLLISIGMLVCIFFNRDLEKQREIMRRIPEAYRNSKNITDTIIDSLLNLQGDIYVYSNDTGVQAKWAPGLDGNYAVGGVKSMAGELIARKEFIKNKDSLGFLLLLKAANNQHYVVNKSLLLGGNDGAVKIWFFTYGKSQQDADSIAPKQSHLPIGKSDFVNSWGVGIVKPSDLLSKEQNLNLPALQAAAVLLKPANSYFYVTSYDVDNGHINMTRAGFTEVIKYVNAVLKNEGVRPKNVAFYCFSRGVKNIISPMPDSNATRLVVKK